MRKRLPSFSLNYAKFEFEYISNMLKFSHAFRGVSMVFEQCLQSKVQIVYRHFQTIQAQFGTHVLEAGRAISIMMTTLNVNDRE